MLQQDLRSKIDKIWDVFWSGGISNPLTVIEQITYLLFIKRLDEIHTRQLNEANTLGQPLKTPIFSKKQDHLRWTSFRDMEPQQLLENFTRVDKNNPGVFEN